MERKEEVKKVIVLQVDDFKFLEEYLRHVKVDYDLIEPAARVKQIIKSARLGDFMPSEETLKDK